jgi:putative endonuclease
VAYYVYILESEVSKHFYIGYTLDLQKRLQKHNKSSNYKWSGKFRPWKVVYFEKFHTKAEAIKREREIKRKKSRIYIDWLVKRSSGR